MRKPFVCLLELADALGLPHKWLKAEAEANRIPCVRIGRRMMFHVESVERALLEGATAQREPDCAGA